MTSLKIVAYFRLLIFHNVCNVGVPDQQILSINMGWSRNWILLLPNTGCLVFYFEKIVLEQVRIKNVECIEKIDINLIL